MNGYQLDSDKPDTQGQNGVSIPHMKRVAKRCSNCRNIGSSMDYEKCLESAEYLLQKTHYRPKIGLVCGTGLAGLGDLVQSSEIIPYSDIPNFPESTAFGHKSRCIFGTIRDVQVFVMQGRFHLYEGYGIDECAMPIRVMKLIGIETLILSNAAGGLHPDFNVGDIMILKDHVNLMGLTGLSPLFGDEDLRFGPRFFSANRVYTARLRKIMKDVGNGLGMSDILREGIYTMVGGPNFESPAELRMLKNCGVDAVGMSTIHEALTAHQSGLNVLAFSLITNACILEEDCQQEPHVDEVSETAQRRTDDLQTLVQRFIQVIGEETSEAQVTDVSI